MSATETRLPDVRDVEGTGDDSVPAAWFTVDGVRFELIACHPADQQRALEDGIDSGARVLTLFRVHRGRVYERVWAAPRRVPLAETAADVRSFRADPAEWLRAHPGLTARLLRAVAS